MDHCLVLAPSADPRVFIGDGGVRMTPPVNWVCVPPGDAGLTRRVKAAGPSWAVVEKRGRKVFSKGLWAPCENVSAARAALEAERSTAAYAKKKQADATRRDRTQAAYVITFESEVREYLRFGAKYGELANRLARQVAAHATPVGSGTVARTERIPVAERAEAAVIAWMRHQTTAYDSLSIPRIAGKRREVRRELAKVSVGLLDRHRGDQTHAPETCALCSSALAK